MSHSERQHAPKKSVYIGVGGKGKATVGLQAEGYSIIMGDGEPRISVEDLSAPGNTKTAQLTPAR